MNRVVHAIGWCVELVLRPLDALAPWLSVTLLGVVTAFVMLVVIRRTSPQRRIAHARAQMASAIFEMRLYLDHPGQLLRAQGRLVGWSVLYVGYLLPSMLVLAVPLGLLFVHLEIRHGFAPLPPHATAVVRIELAPDVAPADVEIAPDPGLDVTARVNAADEHALYARIQVLTPGMHAIVVRAGEASVMTPIVADPDAAIVSPERRNGISQLWSLGADAPFDSEAIQAISIPYPDRSWPIWGPWWLYWLGIATVTAFAFKSRAGVEI
jgi:hypothetical protein